MGLAAGAVFLGLGGVFGTAGWLWLGPPFDVPPPAATSTAAAVTDLAQKDPTLQTVTFASVSIPSHQLASSTDPLYEESSSAEATETVASASEPPPPAVAPATSGVPEPVPESSPPKVTDKALIEGVDASIGQHQSSEASSAPAIAVRYDPLGAISTASPFVDLPESEGEDTAADFTADARLLYRTIIGDDCLPSHLDASAVQQHAAWIRPRLEHYRTKYLEPVREYIEPLRPAVLPREVIYPFGGGDLLTALTTFPDAREVTTISLELTGDPRRIRGLDQEGLSQGLVMLRETLGGLLSLNNSTSANLMKGQRGDLPGQLAFFLVGLAVHGYEPVSLRYFQLAPDGSVSYLTPADIERLDSDIAKKRNYSWTPPDFSEAFANSEIVFRSVDGSGPLRIHRHIAANLANEQLKEDGALLRHLRAHGRVTAMTKAASYCLWNPRFSGIRDYLLENAEYMISDSTGIPAEFSIAAGFDLQTHGKFSGSFLDASSEINEAFRDLWKEQPEQELPFRYGYVDSAGANHLLVARRDDRVPVIKAPPVLIEVDERPR